MLRRPRSLIKRNIPPALCGLPAYRRPNGLRQSYVRYSVSRLTPSAPCPAIIRSSLMASVKGKNRVCYFYDNEIGNYYYGQGHPMKPHRIRMAHNLLLNYGLYRKMEIYVRRPSRAPNASTGWQARLAASAAAPACAPASVPALAAPVGSLALVLRPSPLGPSHASRGLAPCG